MTDNKNRLSLESSAYLLQHAHNPVDWYPWGDEAFQSARKLDRPIFLSIGYSACHWCHVMEEESFKDPETARILNDNFISIKVDREERPDIDSVYMSAVQLLTGHGGWPMSLFLTLDRLPFYTGTYFPPTDRYNMPSFKRILGGIISAWKNKRAELLNTASHVAQGVQSLFLTDVSTNVSQLPSYDMLLKQYVERALLNYDSTNGGFGQAPKFFHTESLQIFMRHHLMTGDLKSRMVVEHTLHSMALGGIFDQIGGGFHRYSTDQLWLAPHFEKMLYDNALLAHVYTEAFHRYGKVEFAQTARFIFQYVEREMTSKEGGFFATQDADSEGIEGKFYVWSLGEIEKALSPEDAQLACHTFGVSDSGNWEGHNILTRALDDSSNRSALDEAALDDRLSLIRRALLKTREERPKPFRDEKIITAWNGMMITAFSRASIVFSEAHYQEIAERAAICILTHLKNPTRLAHSKCGNTTVATGFLDDHAYFLDSLLSLFLATQKPHYLREAIAVSEMLINHFWDARESTFFYTSIDEPVIMARPRDYQDGAIPSAAAVATLSLGKLALVTGNSRILEIVSQALKKMSPLMVKHPEVTGQWVLASEFIGAQMFVLSTVKNNEDTMQLFNDIQKKLSTNQIAVLRTDELAHEVTTLADKLPMKGQPTLYICTTSHCEEPLVGVQMINDFLGKYTSRS